MDNKKSDALVVDVRLLIDQNRFTPYQLMVLILGIMILMLDGYDVGAIGFIAPALVTQWGIARPALAPVLTAALVGLAIGAVASGPLADRIGRRRVVISAVFLFGIFTLASATAKSLEALTWLRFATGLGLGAAFPNTVTLVSEYCPQRRRSLLIGILLTGFVLGTALGGYVAAAIIASHGWQAVLFIGGILPLALFVLLLFLMPESMRFLVMRGGPDHAVRRVVKRMAPATAAAAESFVAHDPQGDVRRAPVYAIFANRLAFGTVLLWLTYFSGLVVIYFVLSWMPTLATTQGYKLETAATITALFTLTGPPGAMLAGWIMDRWHPHVVVGGCYLLAAIFIWQIGNNAAHLANLYWMVGLAGFFINASQSTVSAIAANFYPTIGRATGISWMMGMGRLGGIAGAMVGGTLLGLNLGFPQLFMILAVFSALAGGAVLLKGVYYARA